MYYAKSTAAAHNIRKKDAQLLYMMELASSRLPQALELRTPVRGNRDDFFANHVMRNAPRRSNQMVEISGSMNNAVHLNRMTANDVEHQI